MILELRNVSKVFHSGDRIVRAVDNVSLSLTAGSTFGLIGESGSGKSTLARLIPRLIEPTAGDIIFKDKTLTTLPQRQMRHIREQIQIVFQNPFSSLNPRMTVRQLIGEPLVIHKRASGAALEERVRDMMALVGLNTEHANRFPHEFSGGQRQRIAIARALILEPGLVILDEPTSALDVSVQAQVLNLLLDLQNRFGLTYLLITHDLSVVEYMADQAALMYLGAIVEQGTISQIMRQPKHPYTRALLSDVPSTNPDQRMLEHISLEADIVSAPWSKVGCRFSPRCSAAQVSACKTIEPLLEVVGDGQRVACHLVNVPVND